MFQEVRLPRAGGPLGLSIVGGSDHSSHPFGVQEPGVFISKVEGLAGSSVQERPILAALNKGHNSPSPPDAALLPNRCSRGAWLLAVAFGLGIAFWQ
jgi:hypothetical protein